MKYDLDWDYFQEYYFVPLVNVATISKSLFFLLNWFSSWLLRMVTKPGFLDTDLRHSSWVMSVPFRPFYHVLISLFLLAYTIGDIHLSKQTWSPGSMQAS